MWKLKKDINDATFHFKGIQDTCNIIDKCSENAHLSKKGGEKQRRDIFQLDEDIRKLGEQKDNYNRLIQEEEAEIMILNKQWQEAKLDQRELKRNRDENDGERRLTENHMHAMKIRADRAMKYEEMLENRANVQHKLNTRLHKFIDEEEE